MRKSAKPQEPKCDDQDAQPRTEIAKAICAFVERVETWRKLRLEVNVALGRGVGSNGDSIDHSVLDWLRENGHSETECRRLLLEDALRLVWNLDQGDDLSKLLEFSNYLQVGSGHSPDEAIPLWPKLKGQLMNIALRIEREHTPGSPLHAMPTDSLLQKEAAALVGVHPKTIRDWIDGGKLPSYGASRKVSKAQVLAVPIERRRSRKNQRT